MTSVETQQDLCKMASNKNCVRNLKRYVWSHYPNSWFQKWWSQFPLQQVYICLFSWRRCTKNTPSIETKQLLMSGFGLDEANSTGVPRCLSDCWWRRWAVDSGRSYGCTGSASSSLEIRYVKGAGFFGEDSSVILDIHKSKGDAPSDWNWGIPQWKGSLLGDKINSKHVKLRSWIPECRQGFLPKGCSVGTTWAEKKKNWLSRILVV